MVIVHQQDLPVTLERVPSGWAGKGDVRKFLRIRLRVHNLDAAIAHYCGAFGLLLRQKLDLPGAPTQRAIISDSIDADGFALELIESADPLPAAPSQGLEHITLVVDDTDAVLDHLRSSGREDLILNELSAVVPVQNPSRVGPRSLTDKVALVADVDGYVWQLMEMKGSAPPANRMCAVALHVSDLDASLQWYAEVLGVQVQEHYEAEAALTRNVLRSALVGWCPELEGTVLELRQAPNNGGGTSAAPAAEAVQIVVASRELSTTRAALAELGQGGKVTEIGSEIDPRESVAAVKVQDPDGWCFLFVKR